MADQASQMRAMKKLKVIIENQSNALAAPLV